MALKGSRVFISRKHFAAEVIDSLHDALKQNGAEVCLCSNPECNSINDFHALPSLQHEKFAELRRHGCNIIGPECILRCAKERKPFPKQAYTCCLAMEGVKLLATGFEKEEKIEIEGLVASMCGELHSKASMDISFVIAKNVLAAKYKWAANNLRRPIVTIDWLYQCSREHRLVPYESYKLLPFSGLIICATNVPLDERKEIEQSSCKNGGSYSADLTKKCTHLIAYFPEGDKYKVAKKWGHVKIVNRQWFIQSIAAKACLDEDMFPVHPTVADSVRQTSTSQAALDRSNLDSFPVASTSVSQFDSLKSHVAVSNSSSANMGHVTHASNDASCDNHSSGPMAQSHIELASCRESVSHNDDLYLSDCRIHFVGFTAAELRNLVSMVRDGGGTRHMEFNEKATHIIVGRPTESELKELRQWAMWGAVYVVQQSWLEECAQQKREVTVCKRHVIPDRLLLKAKVESDSHIPGKQQLSLSEALMSKDAAPAIRGVIFPADLKESMPSSKSNSPSVPCLRHPLSQEKGGSERCNSQNPANLSGSTQGTVLHTEHVSNQKGCTHSASEIANLRNIFQDFIFGFEAAFPMDRREEIVHWVFQGGGLVEGAMHSNVTLGEVQREINFLVVSHGSKLEPSKYSADVKLVSSHWIRYCLEEGKMLDLKSHILYQPLPCQVPLPGFEHLRLSVSQYEDRERLLLRNLCYVLGGKFTEKLNKKVSHLLCKFRVGQKYDAACNWGIEVITAEWLFQCVAQNKLIAVDAFRPKEVSKADHESGLISWTQHPSQAARLASGELPSQWQADTEFPAKTETEKLQTGSREKRVTLKAKTVGKSKSKVKTSMAHSLEKDEKLKPLSLSQGGALDPWDEQSAQWSGQPQSCMKEDDNMRDTFQEKNLMIQDRTSDQHELQNEPLMKDSKHELVNESATKNKGNTGTENPKETLASSFQKCATADALEEDSYDPSSDVAAAIEGLLAQTSKLNRSETTDNIEVDRHLLSPEHVTIRRNRGEMGHFDVKRPKQWQSGIDEGLSEAKPCTPSEDVDMSFDESQIDSQVIEYDEGHTGRQMIMERVRTRSMSINKEKGNLRRISKISAWKNDGLGRLFKAAEANK